jgi:uncharacterized protein YPO0396
MSLRTELDADLAQLRTDVKRLGDENAKLRKINAQMIAALNSALPVLRDGLLPVSVNFDAINAAVAKVENAVAEAERDPLYPP